MFKKISMVCLLIMFSILPILTFSGCGLGSGNEFYVTTESKDKDNKWEVPKASGADLDSFLEKCLITFKPGEDKYFVVRSEDAAKKYKNHTYEEKSEYTYWVYYNTYDKRTCSSLLAEGVDIVVSGFAPYREGDTQGNAVFTLYGESYTLNFSWA